MYIIDLKNVERSGRSPTQATDQKRAWITLRRRKIQGS